jgi:hypothetical protein
MPKEPKARVRKLRTVVKPFKAKKLTVEERYRRFFVAAPSVNWRHDDDNFSLEQPSPYRWIPNETTYGIDVTLCPVPDA